MTHNEEYIDLMSIISFDDFSFSEYYNGEQTILKPRLEALGYSNVRFVTGERDSFGPLSRVCLATKDGKTVKLVYG